METMSADIYRDGNYLRRNPSWHAEDSPWKAERIATILRRNDIEPRTVCDVGCGAGAVLQHLQDRLGEDCRFCGYDVSPQAVELAQARANPRLRFELKDVTDEPGVSPGEARTCDVLLMIDVLEHVDDYLGFLRRARGKSRYLVVHVPLDLSAQSVLRKGRLLMLRRGVGHVHFFAKDTALESLAEAGYTVLDYFYTASGIELGSGSPRNRLARLPRRILFSLDRDATVRFLGGYSLLILAQVTGFSEVG